MAKRDALGRGLGALIEDADQKIFQLGSVNEIDINAIEVNPFQSRTKFDEQSLNELASSIKQLGIIQPITVRRVNKNKFQLISGERRFKASKIAGLTKIPAYIRTADDQGLLEMALVENIQREDLNSIEIAISYQRLIEECRLTQETLSERVGKKRSTIANYLRLLKLPAEIQLVIKNKEISMGHARTLVNIEDKNTQIKLCHKIIKNDLSVRKVEDIVRNLYNQSDTTKKFHLNEEYIQLKEHLSKYFHTNIEFKRNDKGKGKIVIPFNSDEELERIIGILDKLNL